tara:strand:- start:276 stop:731 length:456 start_codon:yes stop_codon:yes gene_type:complete
MQLKLTNILSEVGVLATVGITYFLIKNRISKRHEGYNDYEYISNTTFPSVLDKFKLLAQDDALECLLEELEQFLKLADVAVAEKEKLGVMLFQMNRLCQSISKRATNMCMVARNSADPDIVVYAIDCEQDELNMLTQSCDDILKNVLLDIR